MPWRWGPPNRGIRASVPYASPPYSGVVVRLLLLINTASPTLANLVVPLFLIAPPFYTIGGAISFCLLIITIYPPRACLSRLGFADRFGRLRRRDVRSRRSHLLVRAPCDFLEVSYGTVCLPIPLCLVRLILTRHVSRDVIVPIASLIVSPYCFSSLLAPSSDTTGGEECLLGLAVSFMSARLGIISPRYSSNHPSPRLLAPSPHTHQSRGSVVSVCRLLTAAGRRLSCLSARLSIRPSAPLPFAPSNRHGERGERRGGLFSCLVRASSRPAPSIT